MSDSNPTVKIDPILIKELEQAAESNQNVEAVFVLRPPDKGQSHPTPEQTQSTVKLLLERVEQAVNEPPADYNTFKYLGSFVVAASPKFIRKMLEQDEIASAAANR